MDTASRTFRMWDFRVSHDQLLIRSPKGSNATRNFDILFVGVEYIELPTMMCDVRIVEANDQELQHVSTALGREKPAKEVFVLAAGGKRHLVVAAAMKAFENDLERFESSLERFA